MNKQSKITIDSILLILLIFIILAIPFIVSDGTKSSGDILIKHNSPNEDIYRTSTGFKSVIYSGLVNVPYKDSYVAFDEYVNVSEEHGRIKISSLDKEPCYIDLNYTLTDDKQIAIPKINITKERGYYYFTTSIGKEVSLMGYALDCKEVNYDEREMKLVLNNDVKIDFLQANEKQNITTTYDSKTNKLEFTSKSGTTADISIIDPKITYEYNTTYENVNMWCLDSGFSCDGCYNSPLNSLTDSCLDTDSTLDSDLDLIDASRRKICGDSDARPWATSFFKARIANININDITMLNWTWIGETETYHNENQIEFYLWNSSNKYHSVFILPYGSTGVDQTVNITITTNISNYINSTNYTHLLVQGNDYGYKYNYVATDYIQLEIEYTPNVTTILNSPPDFYSTNGLSQYFSCSYSSSSGANLANATLYVWNSDGTLNATNFTTISNPSNSTNLSIKFSADDVYTWNCLGTNEYDVKSWGTNRTFTISTDAPSINLDYPINIQYLNRNTNVYFNFTATDSNGLDTCKLWSNWTGTWHNNYTWYTPNSGKTNYTIRNISSDGLYKWNVWCNDTTNSLSWASTNFTFITDTIFPEINITKITPTTGSQTFTFNFTTTDTNLDTCKYSIFNSTNGYDGSNINLSITCNVQKSATTTDYGTYNLTVYSIDKADNENSTTQSFTTINNPAEPPGGGGGTPPTEVIFLENNTWDMFTDVGTNSYELQMTVLATRTKDIYFSNRGVNAVTISLTCQGTLCEYLNYPKESILIEPNADLRKAVPIYIAIPREIKNQTLIASLVAIDQSNVGQVVQLKVTIGGLGYIQGIVDRFFSIKYFGKVPIPYALIFIVSFIIIYVILYNLILTKLKKLNWVISGIISLILSLILIVFI